MHVRDCGAQGLRDRGDARRVLQDHPTASNFLLRVAGRITPFPTSLALVSGSLAWQTYSAVWAAAEVSRKSPLRSCT